MTTLAVLIHAVATLASYVPPLEWEFFGVVVVLGFLGLWGVDAVLRERS